MCCANGGAPAPVEVLDGGAARLVSGEVIETATGLEPGPELGGWFGLAMKTAVVLERSRKTASGLGLARKTAVVLKCPMQAIAEIELPEQDSDKLQLSTHLAIAEIELPEQDSDKLQLSTHLAIAEIELPEQDSDKLQLSTHLAIAEIELHHHQDTYKSTAGTSHIWDPYYHGGPLDLPAPTPVPYRRPVSCGVDMIVCSHYDEISRIFDRDAWTECKSLECCVPAIETSPELNALKTSSTQTTDYALKTSSTQTTDYALKTSSAQTTDYALKTSSTQTTDYALKTSSTQTTDYALETSSAQTTEYALENFAELTAEARSRWIHQTFDVVEPPPQRWAVTSLGLMTPLGIKISPVDWIEELE
jgi:hypothetical protein